MWIEGNKVVLALHARRQRKQAMSIPKAVIDALQHHIFKQHMPPLVQPDASILGVQLAQCAHKLLQRIPEGDSAPSAKGDWLRMLIPLTRS